LDAVLERITYANQDTGYTVARVATDRSSDLLTVVGPLLGPSRGEPAAAGPLTSRPQYGRQLQVDTYQTMLPAMARWVTEAKLSDVPPEARRRTASSPHPCRTYGVARPAARLVSMALGCRSLIRPPWPGAATRDENRACPAKLGSRAAEPVGTWAIFVSG
jgi:hypothetical protein